jgi:hypothetical protein
VFSISPRSPRAQPGRSPIPSVSCESTSAVRPQPWRLRRRAGSGAWCILVRARFTAPAGGMSICSRRKRRSVPNSSTASPNRPASRLRCGSPICIGSTFDWPSRHLFRPMGICNRGAGYAERALPDRASRPIGRACDSAALAPARLALCAGCSRRNDRVAVCPHPSPSGLQSGGRLHVVDRGFLCPLATSLPRP